MPPCETHAFKSQACRKRTTRNTPGRRHPSTLLTAVQPLTAFTFHSTFIQLPTAYRRIPKINRARRQKNSGSRESQHPRETAGKTPRTHRKIPQSSLPGADYSQFRSERQLFHPVPKKILPRSPLSHSPAPATQQATRNSSPLPHMARYSQPHHRQTGSRPRTQPLTAYSASASASKSSSESSSESSSSSPDSSALINARR